MSSPRSMFLPRSGVDDSTYARGLSAKADRLFLVLGGVLAMASLLLAMRGGQWLPFAAIVVPGLLVMAVQSRLHGGTRTSSCTVALVLMAMVAATIQ